MGGESYLYLTGIFISPCGHLISFLIFLSNPLPSPGLPPHGIYIDRCIVSFDISSNCRHFNGSPLLCPINATSSFSYVFTLYYPRVLHCRIVPIPKLKKIFVLGRKKPPITVVLSEFKRSNLKVTRKFAKTPRGLLDRGPGCGGEQTFRENIHPPVYITTRCFRELARDF